MCTCGLANIEEEEVCVCVCVCVIHMACTTWRWNAEEEEECVYVCMYVCMYLKYNIYILQTGQPNLSLFLLLSEGSSLQRQTNPLAVNGREVGSFSLNESTRTACYFFVVFTLKWMITCTIKIIWKRTQRYDCTDCICIVVVFCHMQRTWINHAVRLK